MLILLSPTKQMDFSRTDKYEQIHKTPAYFNEAKGLHRELIKYNRDSLMNIMKISEKLTDSTHNDIHGFNSESAESGSALYAYSGTVFQWLNPESLGDNELNYAAKHLRILSGLYGILSPDEVICRYRLEMKTPLAIGECENLYQYWKQKITDHLIDENLPIISLASNEYNKAVDKKQIRQAFITMQFKEKTGDKVRTVGMYSKMARGLMAGKIIREQTTDPETLKRWNLDGYTFDTDLSSESDWIFVKKRD
jgi:uncharacterized protein